MLGYKNDTAGENEYEKLQDEKAAEIEARRAAMLKSSEIKESLRRFHVKRREALEAEKLQRVQEGGDLRLQQVQQAYRLAEELSRRKKLEILETPGVQKVESTPRLSPRHIFDETRCRNIEEKVRSEAENVRSTRRWYENDDFTRKELELAEKKKLNYRKDLQDQMTDNRLRRRELEEEKHREHKVFEQVQERIQEEEEEAERRKMETAALQQAEIKAFHEVRQIWKDKRRNILEKEYEKIARVAALKEAEEKRRFEEKTDDRAAKDRLAEEIGRRMTDEEARRTEREEICRELYLEEKNNERANEAVRLARKKRDATRETMSDMVRQRRAAAERKAKEDAIDAAFARQLAVERKSMEEEERRCNQERREKGMRHGVELRETITRRRVLHAQEILNKQSQAHRHEGNVSAKT